MRRRPRPALTDVVRNPVRAVAVTRALLAGALLLWLGFSAASIGGDFSYVLVQNDSMAPTTNHGDIVFLQRNDDYDSGELVAYRHPELGVALHRITADHGGRFTVQSDNRNTADAFKPAPDDILGQGVQTLPRVGDTVRELQSPRNVALLIVGAVGLGVVTTSGPNEPRGPRHRRPTRSDASNERAPCPRRLGS